MLRIGVRARVRARARERAWVERTHAMTRSYSDIARLGHVQSTALPGPGPSRPGWTSGRKQSSRSDRMREGLRYTAVVVMGKSTQEGTSWTGSTLAPAAI